MIENSITEKVWNYLISKGLTAAGTAGLMGNLQAESGLKPNNLEDLCERRLKENGKTYTDETYTSAVDSGVITRAEFLHPLPGRQYGYGLCQWTSPNRKAGLYDLVKSRGVSIADLETQLDWLMTELTTSYKSVQQVLQVAQTVKEASDCVLCNFEQPDDCGASVRAYRAKLGQTYYDQYAAKKGDTMTAIDKVISVAEAETGYLEKASNSQLDNKTANAGSGNYTKYWRDIKPEWQGQAWCAIFIAWCFMQAFGKDLAAKLLKHWPYTYCPTLGSLFTQYANPQRGDIVIFYRNGTFAHTGIVTKVSGDQFWTVEGNTSGASGIIANGGGVCQKSYYNSSLPGTKFCRPDYSLAGQMSETTTTVSTTASTTASTSTGGDYMFNVNTVQSGSKGNDTKLLQRLLKSNGCKDQEGKALVIDGECGTRTVAAIKKYQAKKSLTVDGIAGPKTWASILLR